MTSRAARVLTVIGCVLVGFNTLGLIIVAVLNGSDREVVLPVFGFGVVAGILLAAGGVRMGKIAGN